VQTVSGSNPMTIAIGSGQFATYTYDASGHVTSMQTNEGTTTLVPDTKGNVLSATAPDGKVTSYTYNSHNRILTRTTPEDGATTFAYDGTGFNVTSITRQVGDRSVFTLDANYNITKHDEIAQGSSTPTLSVSYTLNTAGQVTAATPTMGDAYTFQYDGNGFRSRVFLNGKEVQTFTNNPIGKPTHLVEHSVPDTSTFTTDTGYDGAGRVTSQSTAAGAYSCTFNTNGKPTLQSYTPAEPAVPVTSQSWSYTNGDVTATGQGQDGDTPTTNTYGYF
jgi:YD repeat-containing protein